MKDNSMGTVEIVRNLSQVEHKLIGGLTGRQLICFGAAILVGGPFYYFTRDYLDSTLGMLLMIALMFPFFFAAMYKKHGLPAEKWVKYYIESKFIRPGNRFYKTNNRYSALVKQQNLDEEVETLYGTKKEVRRTQKRKKR